MNNDDSLPKPRSRSWEKPFEDTFLPNKISIAVGILSLMIASSVSIRTHDGEKPLPHGPWWIALTRRPGCSFPHRLPRHWVPVRGGVGVSPSSSVNQRIYILGRDVILKSYSFDAIAWGDSAAWIDEVSSGMIFHHVDSRGKGHSGCLKKYMVVAVGLTKTKM